MFKSVDSWLLALFVLAATWIAMITAKSFLRRMGQKQQGILLRELTAPISNLILIVGLRVFAETAPLHPKLAAHVDDAVFILAVVVVLGLIRRAAIVTVEWSTLKASNAKTLQQGFIPLLRNVVTIFVLATGAIMVLKHFDYDVMSLLAALGVGSLAVGLAAKDTLSNMISGFTLIIDRNLHPGDRINLSGSVGDVEEIGLRSTRIRTGDGNTLIVPNSELVNTKILNMSQPARGVSCSTLLRVPLTAPFDRVRALCLATIDQVPQLDRARGKWTNLSSLADGHQLVQAGFWVNDVDDVGGALSEFNSRVIGALAKEQIELIGPLMNLAK